MNGSVNPRFKPTRGSFKGNLYSPTFLFYAWNSSPGELTMKSIFSTEPLSPYAKEGLLFFTFFADNFTLFAIADRLNCYTINKTLQIFSLHSGQKVNLAKSKVLFFRNCSSSTKYNLSALLSMNPSNNFGRYLGFPMFQSTP